MTYFRPHVWSTKLCKNSIRQAKIEITYRVFHLKNNKVDVYFQDNRKKYRTYFYNIQLKNKTFSILNAIGNK